jgi:hypothetical protein
MFGNRIIAAGVENALQNKLNVWLSNNFPYNREEDIKTNSYTYANTLADRQICNLWSIATVDVGIPVAPELSVERNAIWCQSVGKTTSRVPYERHENYLRARSIERRILAQGHARRVGKLRTSRNINTKLPGQNL